MSLATPKLSPYNAPSYDVFSPARREDERGYVLGAPLDGGQSYVPWIGLSTVRELALANPKAVGLVPAEQLYSARNDHAAALTEIQQLRQRVEELEAAQERIAGLAADGFHVVKKQGRPVKKENS